MTDTHLQPKIWVIVALVALRLGVGWHFFQEGADKAQNSFSSAGFLSNAKGPLAGAYHGRVWDADGKARLNYAVDEKGKPGFDLDQTKAAWEQYRLRLIKKYGLDEARQKRSQELMDHNVRQLEWFFATHEDDIDEYFLQLERRERQLAQRERREVASLAGQGNKLAGELRATRGPWLATVDRIWDGYEADLASLAGVHPTTFPLPRPGRRSLDSVAIDQIIPYFDLAIGFCLILGLFTRFASLLGAAFLGSVVVSQWPGAEGSAPTYYQTIEMLALLVLAATAAGRYAGLDFLLGAMRAKLFPSKTGTSS